MPIPAFVDGTLPPGAPECTWEELKARISEGETRHHLTIALRGFFDTAHGCGFVGLAVGGSYVSDNPTPGDLDLLFITPRNYVRTNITVACAELLVNDTAFKRRTGHSGQNS